MMISSYQPVIRPQQGPCKSVPVRFGDANGSDFYTFNTGTTGKDTKIPEASFHLVEKKLRDLVDKIKNGEYQLEPTSTRKWHHNFKHGFKITYCDCHEGRAYLQNGKVTLRPVKPNPDSDISVVYLHTEYKLFSGYNINIRFDFKQGGSATYHYAKNYVDGMLFEFTNAVAEGILKVKKGEDSFDPDQFGQMKL